MSVNNHYYVNGCGGGYLPHQCHHPVHYNVFGINPQYMGSSYISNPYMHQPEYIRPSIVYPTIDYSPQDKPIKVYPAFYEAAPLIKANKMKRLKKKMKQFRKDICNMTSCFEQPDEGKIRL